MAPRHPRPSSTLEQVTESLFLRLVERLAVVVGLPAAVFLAWNLWNSTAQLQSDMTTIKIAIAKSEGREATQNVRMDVLGFRLGVLEAAANVRKPGGSTPQ